MKTKGEPTLVAMKSSGVTLDFALQNSKMTGFTMDYQKSKSTEVAKVVGLVDSVVGTKGRPRGGLLPPILEGMADLSGPEQRPKKVPTLVNVKSIGLKMDLVLMEKRITGLAVDYQQVSGDKEIKGVMSVLNRICLGAPVPEPRAPHLRREVLPPAEPEPPVEPATELPKLEAAPLAETSAEPVMEIMSQEVAPVAEPSPPAEPAMEVIEVVPQEVAPVAEPAMAAVEPSAGETASVAELLPPATEPAPEALPPEAQPVVDEPAPEALPLEVQPVAEAVPQEQWEQAPLPAVPAQQAPSEEEDFESPYLQFQTKPLSDAERVIVDSVMTSLEMVGKSREPLLGLLETRYGVRVEDIPNHPRGFIDLLKETLGMTADSIEREIVSQIKDKAPVQGETFVEAVRSLRNLERARDLAERAAPEARPKTPILVAPETRAAEPEPAEAPTPSSVKGADEDRREAGMSLEEIPAVKVEFSVAAKAVESTGQTPESMLVHAKTNRKRSWLKSLKPKLSSIF